MPEKIHEKFDKAEAVVERTVKLILKIVTAIGAIVGGVFFTWNQLKDDIHHIHEEDEVFQEYLKEVETEEGYAGPIDSAYEDSLYREFYHLDTISTDTPEFIEEDDYHYETEENLDTVIFVPEDTMPVIEQQQQQSFPIMLYSTDSSIDTTQNDSL